MNNEINQLIEKNKKVLDCDVFDQDGLIDFQKSTDQYGIKIPAVGINRFRIPLNFKHKDGSIRNHDAQVSMSVELSAGKAGVNMSRFVAILQNEADEKSVDGAFISNVLKRLSTELRDNETEEKLENVKLNMSFNYPVKQKSLKSDNWGWQYYNCNIEGNLSQQNTFISLTLNYEYSSICPCSLSMSKQYEKEYLEGKTQVGTGIAAAHGQRSNAKVTTTFDAKSGFWIEELLHLIKQAIPTETQSLVKRQDEQAFAILNGEHPMFVEHAARRLSIALNSDSRILDWQAQVVHYESLHSHNAMAEIYKEFN